MTMIDATAVENRRASQNQEILAPPRIAGPKAHELKWGASGSGFIDPQWRIGDWSIVQLLTGAAGVVAAVAVAGAVLGALSRLGSAPVATADSASGSKPVVVAATAPTERSAERIAPSSKVDAVGPAGSRDTDTAQRSSEVAPSAPPATSDAAPEVKVATRPEAEGMKTVTVRTVSVRAVSVEAKSAPAEAPPPASKAAPVAPVVAAPVAAPEAPSAKQPQPAADPPAPSAPPPLETGSIGTLAPKVGAVASTPPVATQAARIASDVRLRAGPGNSHPVLGTIAKGTAVEVVVGCRAWCEVITGEQRGWVFKGFLDTKQASPE